MNTLPYNVDCQTQKDAMHQFLDKLLKQNKYEKDMEEHLVLKINGAANTCGAIVESFFTGLGTVNYYQAVKDAIDNARNSLSLINCDINDWKCKMYDVMRLADVANNLFELYNDRIDKLIGFLKELYVIGCLATENVS